MSSIRVLGDALADMARALQPLKDALESPNDFAIFLGSIGYRSFVTDHQQILRPLQSFKESFDALEEIAKEWQTKQNQQTVDDAELAKLAIQLTRVIASTTTAIARLKDTAVNTSDPVPFNKPEFWEEFARETVGTLVHSHLEINHPILFSALTLLGVLRRTRILDPNPLESERISYVRREIRWDTISQAIAHPDNILASVYGWGQTFDHARFNENLCNCINSLGFVSAPTGLHPSVLGTYYSSDGALTKDLRQVIVDLYSDVIDVANQPIFASVDILIAPIPPKGQPASPPEGFALLPSAQGTVSTTFAIAPNTSLSLNGSLGSTGDVRFEFRPSGADVIFAPTLGTNAQLSTTINYSPELPVLLFGRHNSSRLEIGQLLWSVSGKRNAAQFELGTEMSLDKCVIAILPSDSDGFLQRILPKDGIKANADLSFGWSNSKGFYFGGGAGFETTIPVNIDFLGVIKIDSVYLSLEAKEDSKTKESGIRAVTATTVKVQLGPVSAIVERFGLQATLSFPEKGGNLGVANLDLGFKAPNGVGVVIKAQVVTGGGYLYFDVEKEQYAGVLQLEIAQKFSLTAVGLLTTKMPDGSKGFSLLVIISVRFDPGIQLGYGFSLNGLGGLLGVNRTAKAEVLREGLRHGALGSILFPQNVVENAPQIISNLSAIFPPAKDRFLFGPMAIIGWGGSPPLLSMEIGIILELPDPFRLIILGRLRVTLPSQKDESTQTGVAVGGDEDKKEDTPKIKLQLDSLGIIDFGSGDISLDAFLYDSTIGPFTITGGMALRISFGAKPLFLLSVGGYHPAFQAPAGFPSVDRVSVGISKDQDGVTVRLQLSAYFALTSNTIQFGAHLDLYVHVSEFEIVGLLGFDALIQFKPFGLMVSFEAMVSVKAFGQTLMAIGLQLNLTGPSPWHVWGKAHFTLLFFSGTAEFDALIGKKETPQQPPPIDVESLLIKELQNPSNWTSHLPIGENPLVTFGGLENPSPGTTPPPPSKQVFIHPLAELHINQRLVPLNAPPLTRYGHATPKGATKFTMTVDTDQVVKENLSDWFARAQFYDMTDDAKLAAPSFEQMNSGIRLKANAGYTCGKPIPVDISPASLGDQNNPAMAQQENHLPPSFLSQVAHLGAAGQAPIRASGSAKYRDPTLVNKGVVLNQAQYRVVGGDEPSLARQTRAAHPPTAPTAFSAVKEALAAVADMGESVMSYSAAQTQVSQARRESPRSRLWIVPDISRRRGQR